MRAIGTRRLNLLGASAAGRAQSDLEDLIDMRHFRRAANRAGQAFTHPIHLVAPVDVLVNLHKRDRAPPLEGA